MKITLTIDNGPSDVTPAVLDILARFQVPTVFFVLGKQLAVPEFRRHAERACAEGHAIGNHTYSHTPLGTLSAEAALSEIMATQDLIGDLSDQRLFRPPGGGVVGKTLLNPASVDYLCQNEYSVALWTSVPRDWIDIDGWVETALTDCRSRDWSTLVIHDVPSGAMRHLGRFLESALDEGATFSSELSDEMLPISRGVKTCDIAPYTNFESVA